MFKYSNDLLITASIRLALAVTIAVLWQSNSLLIFYSAQQSIVSVSAVLKCERRR